MSAGLIEEAMVQLELAIGKVKDQRAVVEAKINIKQTWKDLVDEAQVPDPDKSLGDVYKNEFDDTCIMFDPTSSVVALILQIYQMESFCYSELNRSSRYKDQSKVKTLGPWASALGLIICGV